MDNEDLTKRVDELVQFLSTRKDLPEYNVKTVMEMARRLAKYEHDLETANRKNHDMERMLATDDDPYRHGRNRRMPEPGYPQMIELPANTRSVEIKL